MDVLGNHGMQLSDHDKTLLSKLDLETYLATPIMPRTPGSLSYQGRNQGGFRRYAWRQDLSLQEED